MIGVIITFVAALLGLCLLCIFSLQRSREREVTFAEPPSCIPGLSAVFVPDIDILFGRDDYRKLCETPALRSVGGKFRRDRRRIVLLWLAELEGDVRLLWEFRRFLVRNNLPVRFGEEAVIAFTGAIALAYLRLTRAAIFLFGPFALLGLLKNAGFLVQLLSSREVILLARLPALRKAEIEQKWAQHVLLLRAS